MFKTIIHTLQKRFFDGCISIQLCYEQAKLFCVIQGEVWNVAVDIRKDLITYGACVCEVICTDYKKHLWIPEFFAHGFYVLSEAAELVYKVNQF